MGLVLFSYVCYEFNKQQHTVDFKELTTCLTEAKNNQRWVPHNAH